MKPSDEGFLTRWSRRKQDAAAVPANEQAPADPALSEQQAAAEEPFDISTLPSVESLSKDSDFTAFMQKGVPLDLKRNALQKMWLSDPAIRDYIGPSEMSWDFNAAEAFHGYGGLSPLANVAEMVREIAEGPLARVMEPQNSAGDDAVANPRQEPVPGAKGVAESSTSQELKIENADNAVRQIAGAADQSAGMTQNETLAGLKPARRRHGGAVPC